MNSEQTLQDQQIIATAERIARAAHEGQEDKAGAPYWTHPARVARRVRELYPDAPAKAVVAAWLHDVIEDTEWTAVGLREAGLSRKAVDAVVAVTQVAPVPGDAYYAGIVAAGELALMVKHADITDNLDEDRLAKLDPELADKLRAKYAHALTKLGLG